MLRNLRVRDHSPHGRSSQADWNGTWISWATNSGELLRDFELVVAPEVGCESEESRGRQFDAIVERREKRALEPTGHRPTRYIVHVAKDPRRLDDCEGKGRRAERGTSQLEEVVACKLDVKTFRGLDRGEG